ncbi:SMR family transporter [Staphylococcus capitis]|uniref:DMT family transporter n=1 Tax=Staphylococcus capitis TaxID=29388 RepID=UPI00187A1A6D|nr:SMR family transporter [Staphylococcus capitis]MBE7321077.1 QacE family quaternary ammonium compound efflux SMR transporter [Staphylococcus capitis]MDS0999286.1 SMR family transporter [Staphylococcus capitis]MDS4005899.1 SMR family transporter [Staphylococcus capitis]
MQWLKVIIAGFVEIIWVTGLDNAHSLLSWVVTLFFIALSFYLVIDASKHLPVGTVYTFFVGIGAVGTVLVDMIFFNQPFTPTKLILIIILIAGIIGLKLTTNENEEGGQ